MLKDSQSESRITRTLVNLQVSSLTPCSIISVRISVLCMNHFTDITNNVHLNDFLRQTPELNLNKSYIEAIPFLNFPDTKKGI